MSDTTPTSELIYIGPPGTGLSFQLSGIDVHELDQADQLIAIIRRFKEANHYRIIFVDEGLAQDSLTDLEKLNEDALPAIVLLPNPAAPHNVAQTKMNNLVIKAVGSDIVSSKQ